MANPRHPWPSPQTARAFLHSLIGTAEVSAVFPRVQAIAPQALSDWLAACGLGPLAYRRWRDAWPALGEALTADAFAAQGENSLHLASLQQVLGALVAVGIRPIVLKGAALAEAAYGDPGLRPMSDVDLWLRAEEMPTAVRRILDLGYRVADPATLPLDRQRATAGEIALAPPHGPHGVVDLHWSPFNGFWFRHTARIDLAGMWARREPAWIVGESVFRPAAEDLALHIAAHLAVNAHFGPHAAARGLVDLALAQRVWPINWDAAAARARAWRIGAAVWSVLDLARGLLELPGSAQAWERLHPGPVRAALLRRLIGLEAVLAGRYLSLQRRRWLLLLALVDRPADAARLLGRLAVPDPAWRAARYGRAVSPTQHLVAALLRPRRHNAQHEVSL